MSNWETPEQRQIRELRQKISYMEQKGSRDSAENKKLQRELDTAKKQMDQKNRDLQDKLNRADQKLKETQSNLAAQSQAIRQLDTQMKEKERMQNEKIRRMQETHAEEIQQINKEFRANQKEWKEAIVSTRKQMQDGFQRMEKETERRLAEQKVQIDSKIKKVNAALNTKIEAVDSKLDSLVASIQKKENGERELAVYWTEQANRLYQEMQELYRPELFAPKEFEKLRREIETAQGDLEVSRFSSAADGGRGAFYQAMELKETVVQAEMEWNLWFHMLKEREIQLNEMVQSGINRVYEVELDGEEIEDESGMDYWTRGQFQLVKERIEAFKAEKLCGLEEKNTEYLKEQVDALVGLTEELLQVENASHSNFAMAVNRYRLAEKIGDLLGENYRMTDGDGNYFQEENREEYHAIFQNPVTGDQAAVVITPVTGPDGVDVNHIELIIGNADNNPVTRERINEVIQEKLAAEGLIQGGFPCSEKYKDQTAKEVQRVGNIREVEAGAESVRASREGLQMPNDVLRQGGERADTHTVGRKQR